MANTVEKAVLRAKINDVMQEVFARTNADLVLVDESGTTLAAKLTELLADLATRAKSEDVTAEIQGAIDGLIGGAPGTYDTLKEVADYIEAHEDVVTALNSAIGSKADKTAVEALQTALEQVQSSGHTHDNKAVLDGITAEKISGWDGKTKVYVSAQEPADAQNGDIWFQLLT